MLLKLLKNFYKATEGSTLCDLLFIKNTEIITLCECICIFLPSLANYFYVHPSAFVVAFYF